jgi:protein phosphatase
MKPIAAQRRRSDGLLRLSPARRRLRCCAARRACGASAAMRGSSCATRHARGEHAVRANNAIFQASQSQPQYAGMGTTLVVALWHDDHMIVGHIGDSRLYRMRGSKLEQVTRDHSLLQEQIDSGLITKEQARHSQNKTLVTRAVGIDPEVDAEVHSYPVQPGDIYLLCSDGLNDMVTDEDMELTLSSLQANLPLAAEQLVQQANDNGGRDNVSVILVRVLKNFPARSGLVDRMKSWFR